MSNESRASITESLSEFFDAQEVLLSASSSENEVRMKSHSFYQSHKCAALSVSAVRVQLGTRSDQNESYTGSIHVQHSLAIVDYSIVSCFLNSAPRTDIFA